MYNSTMDKAAVYYQATLERLQSQETLHAEFGSKAVHLLTVGGAFIGIGTLVLSLSGPSILGIVVFVFILLAFEVPSKSV